MLNIRYSITAHLLQKNSTSATNYIQGHIKQEFGEKIQKKTHRENAKQLKSTTKVIAIITWQ